MVFKVNSILYIIAAAAAATETSSLVHGFLHNILGGSNNVMLHRNIIFEKVHENQYVQLQRRNVAYLIANLYNFLELATYVPR